MRKVFILATLIVISLLTACNNPKQQTRNPQEKTQRIDTTKSIRIGQLWITPKSTFELESGKENSDTLLLLTCAGFVYSPFGEIKDKKSLLTSKLKNFNIIDRITKQIDGESEIQILTLKSSRLILFFDNDPEAITHSYIFKGEIFDKEVNFTNGIKIGMTKERFIKTFFEYFPEELFVKYNCIAFQSCVDDVRHTYTFENGKLKSLRFNQYDTYWKINYE